MLDFLSTSWWICGDALLLLLRLSSESASAGADAEFTCSRRFHHSPLTLRWPMLLRSAASALLRTSAEIPTLFPVSTVRFVRQSLRHPPRNRPFSTSVCLCKKKKKSLWLQFAEGQTMDGNIEEILAPLRLAVKEQVTLTYPLVPVDLDWRGCSRLDLFLWLHTDTLGVLAWQANRLTWPAAHDADNEWGQPLLASC